MSDELFELPEGWQWVPLESVASAIDPQPSHRTPPEFSQGVPYIGIGDINDDGTIDFNEARKVSPDVLREHKERYTLQKGDFIFGKIGTLGKPFKLPSPFNYTLSANVILLQPYRNFVADDWVFYFMKSSFVEEQLQKDSRATSQAAFGIKKIRLMPVPVPPLNEQKRIVAKIEELNDRHQRAKQALEAIPELCDRFRQSVLAAAFRGDLTSDWREENPDVEPASVLLEKLLQSHELAGGHKKGNAAPPTDGVHILKKSDFPETWEVVELKDLCKPGRPITYGILKPGPELENGVPYIRVADFPNDQLNLSTIRKTSFEIDQQFSRSRLEEEDVLLSIRGTVGRICRIPINLIGANITQDSARLSIQDCVSTDYICLMLKAKSTQRRMEMATKGVAVRGINIGDVRVLQFPLPPYPEQVEIVLRVNSFLKSITQVEQQKQSMTKEILALNQSILAKAFRGELVEQDPNDEPASVLLDRIRAEREKLQGNKKSGSARGKRKKATDNQLDLPGVN